MLAPPSSAIDAERRGQTTMNVGHARTAYACEKQADFEGQAVRRADGGRA